jgi:hypothetical protein
MRFSYIFLKLWLTSVLMYSKRGTGCLSERRNTVVRLYHRYNNGLIECVKIDGDIITKSAGCSKGCLRSSESVSSTIAALVTSVRQAYKHVWAQFFLLNIME